MVARPLLTALLFASLSVATLPSAGSVAVVVTAVGPAHHILIENRLVYHPCDGDGVATFSYSYPGGRMALAIVDDGCIPFNFSVRSGCQGVAADGTFHCHRQGVDATLTPEGVLTFSWIDATFREYVWADMTRVGPGV